MDIKSYDELNEIQRDILKEVGSISVGNAATALSALLSQKVRMTVPDVSVLEYNEAVNTVGNPEDIIAGVLVEMSGDLSGTMLLIEKLDFVNMILRHEFSDTITDYSALTELQISALEEIGNIIISSFINALSRFADMNVDLSVPSISVNMLGGIITVPMAMHGYQTDKVMMIDGKFICDEQEVSSNLLMLPDIDTLNRILEKLEIKNG